MELKASRDKAEALARYAKQRQYGLEIENDAAEIRLVAERRLGILLKEMAKDQGGRPPKNLSHDTTGFSEKVTLDELGITRDQSSRWQKEAALPEDAFQSYVAETKANGEELTTAALLREARAFLPTPTPRTTRWGIEYSVRQQCRPSAHSCRRPAPLP